MSPDTPPSRIVTEAQEYALKHYQDFDASSYHYHNLAHTIEVVEICTSLCSEMNFSQEEMNIILIAAWFHDLGYQGTGIGHEEVSAELAREFMLARGYQEDTIQKVEGCIIATKLTTEPQNSLEEVVCDADLYYLGTDLFLEKSNGLRLEWEMTRDQTWSEKDWIDLQIRFLKGHTFYTPVAIERYQKKKESNLEMMLAEKEKLASA